MLIGFDAEVCIVNNTLPTTLQIPFCESEAESIFNYYDPKPVDGEYFKPREFTKEEIQYFLCNLENIADKFTIFYLESLDKQLNKSFRKK